MLKSILYGTAIATGGAAAYVAWQDFSTNEIIISINEFIVLSQSDTQSFTDFSTPIDGEVRVESNTSAVYKYLLRLNAAFVATLAGVKKGSNSKSLTVSSPQRTDTVNLTNLEVNEIVDVWNFEQKQQIIFAPACVSHQTLLRYKTMMHEAFLAPVSARDCLVSSQGSGMLQLSFSLMIHAAVLDLDVNISLPKRAKVLSVNTDRVGTWRPLKETGGEILWSIGACGTGSILKAEKASFTTVRTDVRTKQQHTFGQGQPSSGAAPVRDLPDETIVIPNIEEYPQAELGECMERIHFDLVYVIVDDDEDQSDVTAQQSKKKSRQKREDRYDEAADTPPPAVSLSYAMAATASGLTVVKLQVQDEKRTWCAADSKYLFWRVVKMLYYPIDTFKLAKKAQYTTRFTQTLKVEVQQ